MPVPSYFGKKLKEARLNADYSLRDLAGKLGVTHVFLGEVERGVKARLSEKHWDVLLEQFPNLTEDDLREWSSRSQILELDLRDQGEKYQELSLRLARAIHDKRLTDGNIRKLMQLLGDVDGD